MLQYLYFEEISLIEPPQKEKLTVEDRKPTYMSFPSHPLVKRFLNGEKSIKVIIMNILV